MGYELGARMDAQDREMAKTKATDPRIHLLTHAERRNA
jgi:hypothetical protein